MKTKMTARVLLVGFMFGSLVVATAGQKAAPPEVAQVVAGNNAFAVDLYQKMADGQGNLIFSPYSISTALAMTYGGAKGETEQQMAGTLHFTLAQNALHPAFGWLTKDLNDRGKKGDFELVVANRLWGQAGYKFLDSYLKLVSDNYGAALETVNFAASEPARQTINDWVEKQTRNKIKDLIPRGVLTADTRLVLTNAIYFKGKWALEFEKKNTRDDSFWLTPENEVQVPMMNQKSDFAYSEDSGLQVLVMPYKGEELSMVVLLPEKRDGISPLEKSITTDKLEKWIKQAWVQEVEVHLPRFKLEHQLKMKPTLAEMGLPIAFSDGADFSGMDGTRDLRIQDVIHKAFIEVNEEGTEAAAATGVVAGIESVAPEEVVFNADHPFIFLIRDNKTGSILFMGRVMDPRG